MSALPIVCDNCGAKYRLPENSPSDKAKCKACGSAIDVAAQRAAAAQLAAGEGTPKAAAAAKPAVARPARGADPVRAERPSRREPGNRPAAPARGDGGRDRGDHGRRGHKGRDEQGRKVGPVLILCAVGAVIAVAAGIWFLAR